ncbi:MAG: EscU/YscU/HrcU family type III secretion system export apparatus switch protein [Pseudomonadota bacterium]
MSDSSTEEKSLPASQKKLRDARQKGQLAKSNDFVMTLGLGCAIAYVWLNFSATIETFQQVMILSTSLFDAPFDDAMRQIGTTLTLGLVKNLGPFFIMLIVAGFVANILTNRGIIFSIEPLIPKMDRINPSEGLQRIWSIKSLTELVKSLVKIIALVAAIALVNSNTANELVRLPQCGLDCTAGGFAYLIMKTAVVALIVFVIAGALDIIIQQWLFQRDMRMTKSEMKQEIKSMMGDPKIKAAHKRIRKEMATARKIGVRQASVLIFGGGIAIGVRYVKDDTHVPLIVSRSAGERSVQMLREAQAFGIPIYQDSLLSRMLYNDLRAGKFIGKAHFDATARALMAAQ